MVVFMNLMFDANHGINVNILVTSYFVQDIPTQEVKTEIVISSNHYNPSYF
jgi:hypothetical protein